MNRSCKIEHLHNSSLESCFPRNFLQCLALSINPLKFLTVFSENSLLFTYDLLLVLYILFISVYGSQWRKPLYLISVKEIWCLLISSWHISLEYCFFIITCKFSQPCLSQLTIIEWWERNLFVSLFKCMDNLILSLSLFHL